MRSTTALIRPFWLAALAAAAAGALFDGAFPDRGAWWLAPIAIGLLLASLLGRGFWSGSALGLLFGLSFWLLQINWLSLYLGPLPWIALSSLQALYLALSAGLIALALRWLPRAWPGGFGRLLVTPAVVSALWSARELLAANWPYGGFAWGRVGMSQTEGIFTGAFSWVGGTGVGLLLVGLSALAVQLLREPRGSGLGRSFGPVSARRRGTAALLAASALLALLPAWQLPVTGSLRILAVQGAVDASLFTRWSAGDILVGQTKATLPFLGERVDAVVWPENSSDLDPLRNPYSARVLTSLSRDFNAPLFVGSITKRDGEYFNSSIKWQFPEGAVGRYDKVRVVPFAEYMPDREFWRPFAPDLIDLITREYTPGTLEPLGSIGRTVAGIAICFDIADDALLQRMTDGGAQLILAQTNNADFGRSDESLQQLAIARMRALETGLAVVNISTVGSSAVIDGQGRTLDELPEWQPGGMLVDVPVATAATPASLLGTRLGLVVSVFGLVVLALGGLLGRRAD